MKARKPTLKALKAELATSRELCDQLRTALYQAQRERDEARKALSVRVDTAMIDARIGLANALGQMGHSISEAIKFVIGKEVM